MRILWNQGQKTSGFFQNPSPESPESPCQIWDLFKVIFIPIHPFVYKSWVKFYRHFFVFLATFGKYSFLESSESFGNSLLIFSLGFPHVSRDSIRQTAKIRIVLAFFAISKNNNMAISLLTLWNQGLKTFGFLHNPSPESPESVCQIWDLFKVIFIAIHPFVYKSWVRFQRHFFVFSATFGKYSFLE